VDGGGGCGPADGGRGVEVLPGCGVAVPARRDLLDMFTLQDK